MFELPTEIVVNNTPYKIRNRGDFRMVLDCFSALEDDELEDTYKVASSLIIFYEGIDSIDDIVNTFGNDTEEAINKMYNFFNCNEKHIGAKSNYKLIDWEGDSQLIVSAINNVARKEVRAEEYLHWWTFMGYYLAVGECPLSTVVSIRKKIAEHKKLEDFEKDFKKNNPEYFIWDSRTLEQKQAEKEFEEFLRQQ